MKKHHIILGQVSYNTLQSVLTHIFAKTATDTLVVTTLPQMHCQNCEKKIKSNIRFVKGTKKVYTSVDEQKVTIVYDSKKAKYDDFVAAFKKIGYEIRIMGK